MSERRKRLLLNLAVVALTLLVLLLFRTLFPGFVERFVQAAMSIILPFSIALFLSYLLAPLFRLLERKIKQRNRLLNTAIVFGGVGVLLFFFFRYAGSLIYNQAVAFIENDWPRVVAAIDAFLGENTFIRRVYEYIQGLVTWETIGDIEIDFLALFQSLTLIVITIVLVPVFLFFILNDRKRIYEAIVVVFPKRARKHVIELSGRANRVIEEYFNGRFLTMFVMAIVFTIVFFIFGFRERSFLFGFMLGFFDIVPYVGPFIAMLLPVLYSLTDETLLFGDFAPLAIAVTVVVGQIIQNNVAQPLIMGKETKLHPLLVLSAFVFFGYLFGVVGIILAIPITGMIRETVRYLKELHEDKIQLDEEEKARIQATYDHTSPKDDKGKED